MNIYVNIDNIKKRKQSFITFKDNPVLCYIDLL